MSFLQQTSNCKFSLGNTTEKAELSKFYLRETLASIRSQVSVKNMTFDSVMVNYESDVFEYVVKGMEFDWEKTDEYTLWKSLRSHKALLDVLQTSCELLKFAWYRFLSGIGPMMY